MEQNYYRLLDVDTEAGVGEIRNAFRRLARQCHPDTAPPDRADPERFQALANAYRILVSSEQRDRYDEQLAASRPRGLFWRQLRRRYRAWCGKIRRSGFGKSEGASTSRASRRPLQGGPSRRLAFEQILEARLRDSVAVYRVCEDGVIRRKDGRSRTQRPPSIALRSAWWMVLLGMWAGWPGLQEPSRPDKVTVENRNTRFVLLLKNPPEAPYGGQS